MEERIKKLVQEEFSKMTFSKKYSNQAKLSNICEDIIYNNWGVFNENIKKLINMYVSELIPDEED